MRVGVSRIFAVEGGRPGAKAPLILRPDFRGLKAPAPSEKARGGGLSSGLRCLALLQDRFFSSLVRLKRVLFYFELGVLVCVESGGLGVAR